MAASLEEISFREFARRDGCDPKLVRRAVADGTLVKLAAGGLDAALVGSGWRKTNRRSGDKAGNVLIKSPSPSPRGDKPDPVSSGAVEIDFALEEDAQAFIRRVLAGDYASLAEAERIKENGLALKHMLDGQRKAGSLIPLQAAQDVFFEAARDNRDAWTGWVGRIAVTLAAELGVDARLLTEALNRHVHQHLTELGEPEFDPDVDQGEG